MQTNGTQPASFNVITVEREFGAGGTAIATRLAQRLGWELLDRALTTEIAKLAEVDEKAVSRCDECVDPLMYRLAKVFWRGSYERSMPVPDRAFDTDAMVRLASEVIRKAASRGKCVIVGRGSPYILRECPDAFKVFLFAPRDFKLRYLMENERKSEKEAAELVDTIDQERAGFVRRYFGKEWPHRYLYHAMLNTAIGVETCVDVILQTMKVLETQGAATQVLTGICETVK